MRTVYELRAEAIKAHNLQWNHIKDCLYWDIAICCAAFITLFLLLKSWYMFLIAMTQKLLANHARKLLLWNYAHFSQISAAPKTEFIFRLKILLIVELKIFKLTPEKVFFQNHSFLFLLNVAETGNASKIKSVQRARGLQDKELGTCI